MRLGLLVFVVCTPGCALALPTGPAVTWGGSERSEREGRQPPRSDGAERRSEDFSQGSGGAAPSVREDQWLGKDKALHFGASAVIAGSVYGVGTLFLDGRTYPAILGGSVALAAGGAKEGWDALGHGTPSWRDFAWDVVGTATGLGVALLVDVLVRSPKREHASLPLSVRF